MDNKHRHQLEQNLLAKWLITQHEEWIRPNSSWLGYAVLGVLVVVAALIGTARLNSWNQAAAWKQYYAALQSPLAETELALVANSTGVVGVQARLALAWRLLAEGCEQVFRNKVDAITTLDKAIDSFQRVQKGTNDPLLLQQAGFGLGQCWEVLAAARIGDDLTKAEEEYQKLAARWGEEFFGQRAKQQLALIRQPATKTFIELAAAKVPASFGADDFKVEINPDDPFATGQVDLSIFDQKADGRLDSVPVLDTAPVQEESTEQESAEESMP